MTLAPQRRESAKERSLRIPLDYLHRSDPLARIKWQASVVLVLAAAGYVAALFLFPRWGNRQASPGELSAAHRSFHDDCRACHQQPLAPLRSDAVDLAHWTDPARARQVAEGGCLRCHEVRGHHASALADEVPRCAACHREHQGPTADLRRTADAQCTRCHAAIAAHRRGDSQLSPALANVTAFADGNGHPAFRSLASGDPGNIHFNHWLHLQPGVAPAASQRKLHAADLPPADRARDAASKDGLVQLTCTDCHQPDERTGGAYLRPIAYAEHCQTCHPLQVAIQPEGPPLAVPHGMDRAALAALIDGLVIAQSLSQLLADARPAASSTEPRESPGSVPARSDDLPLVPGRTLGRNLAQRLAADLVRQRSVALRSVAGRCLQCHQPRSPAATPGAADDVLSELPELAPAAIPSRWFAHSRFDHSAHRHVACRECHAAAYRFEQAEPTYVLAPPAGDTRFRTARDADEVMIADRQTCLRCHTPRRLDQGGARHDCTGCHDYHGGELRLGHARPLAAGRWPIDLPRPATANIRLVSQGTATPAYVDERSCAAAGCHGSTRADASFSARAATLWLARDPHREAEELLWTERAREMTARLAASPRSLGRALQDKTFQSQDGQAIANRHLAGISDAEHVQVLAQRCVACHVVPETNVSRNHHKEGGSLENKQRRQYAAQSLGGVGCQSCHGPAANWLHTHYRQDFDRNTRGFIDTKSFPGRASVCTPCHVGPAALSDDRPAQLVDHDLIAAGHPRLAFDFFAYFESLPAHWDWRRDQEKHAGFYHFALWQAGHDAVVAQEGRLAQWFEVASRSALPEGVAVPEFSTIDCQACHHALGTPVQRPSPALWRPRVPNLPLAWEPGTPLPPLAERLGAAARALESVPVDALTYDTACRMYSLVRALAADLAEKTKPVAADGVTGSPPEPHGAAHSALGASLAAAGKYLARESFSPEVWSMGEPTPYDGPTAFAPTDWSHHRDALVAALRQVRQSLVREQAVSEVQGR